tara:strand:- start:22789 stop:23505 length:717 start_codon:yes stop_codon:yes gene_type:complete
MKTKTIKNITSEFENNEMTVDFKGDVTITWETKKVLHELLETRVDNTPAMAGWQSINFEEVKKFMNREDINAEDFAFEPSNEEVHNRGWRKWSDNETAMCRANGWKKAEITKLKKLGIIGGVNCGDGDWDTARIWAGDNFFEGVMLFEDVDSERDMEARVEFQVSEFFSSFTKAVQDIKSIGFIKGDGTRTAEDEIADILVGKIEEEEQERRRAVLVANKKRKEIAELKKKIKELEGK